MLVRVNASSSGDDVVLDREPVETDGEIADGWVYGVLEYRHDIFDPRTLFMLLMAHPDSQVPLITGGYAETDVWVTVEIRGIDVPRGLQSAEVRHRPHRYLARERARWDRVMGYIWNVCGNSGTFRVGNFEVVEGDRDMMLSQRDELKIARDCFKVKYEESVSDLSVVEAKLVAYQGQGFWGRLLGRVPY